MRSVARLLGALLAMSAAPAAAEPLQPSQMVRSLQLVQERIAAGDHAALAMQRKLLSLIDARLQRTDTALLQEQREWEAVLIYAMSGGNPATVEALMPDLVAGEGREAAAWGVLNHLRGAQAPAREAFKAVDPMASSPELGAYLSLVKGVLEAGIDPPAALGLLDQARLLAPGTLVEEAALRRSIALATEGGDRGRFLLASSQYSRRFLHSPYASQFADAFVAGVVALHEGLDLVAAEDVTAGMDPERRRVIFLRIARRAAIEHAVELAEFAASRAGDAADARATLYAALPLIASPDSDNALARLQAVDPAELTEDDRALLQAARSVALGLKATPDVADAARHEPASPAGSLEPDPASPPPQVAEDQAEGDDRHATTRAALAAVDLLLEKTQ